MFRSLVLMRTRSKSGLCCANLLCVDAEDENGADVAAAGRAPGLIGAVDNVLRLLRLFQDQEMIRVNQVARDMGVSRSTVHRMLTTLSHHGFVEQDEFSRAYKPGPALVDIGLAVMANMDIPALSRETMLALRDETKETIHLAHLRGTDIVFLESIESQQMVRTGSRVGWSLPAHATAAGKALLADLPDEKLEALYPTLQLPRPTPNAAGTLEELRRQLAEVKTRGYAINNGESEADVSAVAAAVRDKKGRARAALVTTAPKSRADENWIVTVGLATLRAARELGDKLP